MAGKTAKSIELGQHIVVGGLVVQIIFFGLFIAVAATFHTRIAKQPAVIATDVPWKRHICILYAASALILIRSLFRVAEYQQGNEGYLLGHEVFLYIFDALLMFFVVILFNVIHPGEINTALRSRGAAKNSSELSSMGDIDAGRAPETV